MRREFGDAVYAIDLAARTASRRAGIACPAREQADGDPDEEEQGRGDRVVPGVDRERQVRLGVEEVERERGDAGPDRAGLPAAGDRGENHDENEQQRDVGVRDRVADADERARDDDRADRSDRHPHGARQAPFIHISVVPGD